MLWVALLALPLVRAGFLGGKVQFSQNEYPELSGRMSVRAAVFKCENDLECAGFVFRGTLNLDRERNIAFFRFVNYVSTASYGDVDWNTYLVERSFATYIDQVPMGAGNVVETFTGTTWVPNDALRSYCVSSNCTAVSVSESGTLHAYSTVDMASMRRAKGWVTYVNLHAHPHTVVGLNELRINLCCPQSRQIDNHGWGHLRNQAPRVPCSMSQEDFTEYFIRTMTPVVITGCDYSWLDHNYYNVNNVVKMFYNVTPKSEEIFEKLTPGFTHIGTPNDYVASNEEIARQHKAGSLRSFIRLRRNAMCHTRGVNCSVLENFPRPAPVPEDLYTLTDFENNLDWMIVSQEGTGSHPHNDPDLTGAWNYLINGYKWWVLFPAGIEATQVQCRKSCSPDISDIDETYRWFSHVLPQIRNVNFFGGKIWEFVQSPGEAVYIPHGLTHAVLNLKDNVAITENHLFVDGLQELMSKMVLDEISIFRPGWDELAFKKLYYGGIVSKMDRQEMRDAYLQTVGRISETTFCDESLKARLKKYDDIFADDKNKKATKKSKY